MTAGQAGANVLSQLLPGSGNIDAKNPLMSLAKGSVAMLNPALKIPLEQVGNINTYTGAPIVGRRIGELPPSEQSTQATSPVMKGLGKILGMIPGVGKTPLASPVRWEHAFRSMFPGPGEMVLAAADQALGPKVPPARGAIEELAKRPWSGPIVRSLIPSVHSQERLDLGEDFYAALQEAGAATTMINNLMKSGRTDEARTRLADPAVRKSLQMNRPLQALAEQLGQVNQWRNRVIQNEGMTPEAKRQEMQKIWMTELQILRRGAALVKQ
jgi:hypothetical protein